MATLPNFDPNNLSGDEKSVAARRNRVISDIAEPGSTFKIVVVSGALNDGLVTPTDVFDCEHGRFLYAGKVLRDHESYGPLTVEQIITKSSNIGAAKIGIKMGEPQLYHYIRDFGFGTRTGIPLGGEVYGSIRHWTNWTKLSISRIPMGHEVAATPLQMVMAMCAIANNGWLMRPMLVKNSPQRVRQVVSETASRQMVAALKTVISPAGTGAKAKLEHYTLAGKTGTAQKIVNGAYSNEKFFTSFIGFFPADDPELCISVVMDEPKNGYYGGQAAAPVFKQIAERAANYLNIRPDTSEETPLSETITSASANLAGKTVLVRSP
jgi:cell division protein FtsI/penicillin-binding protein 2